MTNNKRLKIVLLYQEFIMLHVSVNQITLYHLKIHPPFLNSAHSSAVSARTVFYFFYILHIFLPWILVFFALDIFFSLDIFSWIHHVSMNVVNFDRNVCEIVTSNSKIDYIRLSMFSHCDMCKMIYYYSCFHDSSIVK